MSEDSGIQFINCAYCKWYINGGCENPEFVPEAMHPMDGCYSGTFVDSNYQI